MKAALNIQILVDNPQSWYVPYAQQLCAQLQEHHSCRLIHTHTAIEKGDILFLLSCEKIFKDLSLNTHNIVVHPSDLPKGRGWSPLSWAVIEGAQEITATLFEAVDAVDAGPYYLKETFALNGNELIDELREKSALIIANLVCRFVMGYPDTVRAIPQKGEPTFYKKRSLSDSELDIHKTIEEQFNLLRITDNERYPAFFYRNNEKFILKIFKA